jgi:hypothetical protein
MKKLKPVTHVTRKFGGHVYHGVYRYGQKKLADEFAEMLRRGNKKIPGHKARVIQYAGRPKYAVFMDGLKSRGKGGAVTKALGTDQRQIK